ncbi:MAG: ABC transporter substrate-binding protein [Burkholderiaceae bacterium]|nr:ABC transporter substrate-binding protein [Burkholderiaceae bacterium]
MNIRKIFSQAMTVAAVASASVSAFAAQDLKIGTVLSFSQVMGVYGNAILDGMNLAIEEAGGSVAGRKIVVVKEDDKNDPKTALQLVRRYVKDDQVDFLVGPVASHIASAIRDEVHRSKTFLLIANAGNDELTRELCSPYVVRTSFSNWQWNYPMGEYTAASIGKRAAIIGANYVAGKQMGAAFAAGFKKGGGTIVEEMWPAMGTADFATTQTKLRSVDVDSVWVFNPGSGTVNFVNQYAQAKLKPVQVGPQSNADEFFFSAMGDNALGIYGSGQYVLSMATPRNQAFVAAFKKKYNRLPAATDVSGYDSMRLIIQAVKKLNGNVSDKQAVRDAMVAAEIDSPRGYFKIDAKNGNVIQNVYITKVVKRGDTYSHEVLKTYERVTDPDTTCKLNWN